MKKLSLFVLGLILISCSFAMATDPPKVVVYEVKRGNATFAHETHAATAKCSECHHTKERVSCKQCHGVDKEILSAKKAFHKLCKDCHKTVKKGPTSCKTCHIK